MNDIASRLARHIAVASVVLGTSATAYAQGGNLALAEDLFRQGTAAMEAKDYATACPKFAESNRLDPQLGTMLNLARCHELQGKVASAWGEYNEVAAIAQKKGEAERVKFAQQHAQELEPKLARVAIKVDKPAQGESIKVDGVEIGQSVWGTPIPVDPGSHDLEATAPGKKQSTQKFDVASGASKSDVTVAALEDAPKEGNGSFTVNGQPVDDSGKRTLGFVLAGVGVAGLAAGAITGFMYLGKRSDYNNCPEKPGFCGGSEASDSDQKSSAQTMGIISTIGFGVGVVGIGVGSFLILTSKSSKSTSAAKVRFVPGLGGGAVVGTF